MSDTPIKKVWNVTIGRQKDCVIMTDFEAMQVKMKFMPNISMTDMTVLHNLTPESFNKENREYQLTQEDPLSLNKLYENDKWRHKATWTFESLMEMKV